LNSCRKAGLFEKAGPVKSEIRPLTTFNEIILNDKVNLILTYDTIKAVRVETGENLLTGIETLVKDNVLTISDKNEFKWSRKLDYVINVHVSTDMLKRITYYGAGNISSTNVYQANEFIVDSWTGTGSINLKLKARHTELIIRMANADITVHGESGFTGIYCADHGSMDLRNFPSEQMTMDHRSIRNSTIHVTRFLTSNILYKGNVYYLGSPQIEANHHSSGKLIHLP
jgi:hypothetical protein